jgi:hypothetical protein
MRKLIALVLIVLVTFTGTSYASTTGSLRGSSIEGYITDWSGDSIRIEEYDGTVYLYTYDTNTGFYIDNIPAEAVDFKIGMEVFASVAGSRIVSMEGYSTENPGYIPPGGKVRNGVVQRIDRDQIIIKLPTGDTGTYYVSPAAIVLRKGETVPLSTLYEGDRVRLFFDRVDTAIVSRIQIQGESVTVKDLYKGSLGVVDYVQDIITFYNVQRFENGKWKMVRSSMSIPYSDEAQMYMGGYTIPYFNLKYYRGKEVYMAVKDFFGTDRIERMVLKSQYESAYIDKIGEINWFAGAFELSNQRNITFNEGTIIIKNGRLVDQYAINPKSDAFVVADGRSSALIADVIYIYNEDINNSNIGQNLIYAGRLDQIVQGSAVLKDFFLLDRNSWVSFSGEKELYFDSDTDIFNMEALKEVSPEEFLAGYYAVDEDSDYVSKNKLKDWYAYIYTDGDRISCIALQKNMDSLLRQRISNGIIDSNVDDSLVGWTVSLRNGADWSSRKEKWMARSAAARVNIEKALVIKDGRTVPQEELLPGDRLYIVRDDFLAKVVIVK